MERVTVGTVELRLAQPDQLQATWIGSDDLPRQLRAAWSVLGEGDTWMSPRITGKPGVGKTTLGYTTARALGLEVYIQQATMDTRPEDLLVQPVIAPDGGIAYVASPIVTAMLRGGVAILDEANRMPEKSFASLASLLDDRRYVESVIAGVKIHAHPDFRFAVTIQRPSAPSSGTTSRTRPRTCWSVWPATWRGRIWRTSPPPRAMGSTSCGMPRSSGTWPLLRTGTPRAAFSRRWAWCSGGSAAGEAASPSRTGSMPESPPAVVRSPGVQGRS
jgi:hypothetical protein